MMTRIFKGRSDLPAFLALAFLSLAMTYPLVFHLTDQVPSDLRDPLYTMWLLSWDVRTAGRGFADFADANIFYPHRGVLFYGDALPALALLGAPVLLLSGNPVLTYNILFLLSFFIAGLGMYFLVKDLAVSRNAAFAAALIFAFFPYHFAHLSHLEILYLGWIPFCLLFIHRFFEEPKFKHLLAVAIFYVLQVLSCAYYGQYLTVFAGLMAVYLALSSGCWRKVRFWRDMAILLALTGAVLLPYFLLFIKVHQKMLFVRSMWEVKFFSAELQHYLAVPTINVVWGWLTGSLGAQEWQLFPGLVAIVLTLVWLLRKRPGNEAVPGGTPIRPKKRAFAVWDVLNLVLFAFVLIIGITGGFEFEAGLFKVSAHRLDNPFAFLLLSLFLRGLLDRRMRAGAEAYLKATRPAEKFYLFMLVFAWLLSFGPVIRCLGREIIAGPYGLLFDRIPGFQNVRVPSRFAALMMVGLSVLAGRGALQVMNRWRSPGARTRAAAAIGALIILEYLSIPIPLVTVPIKDRLPEIYTAVGKLPAGAAIIELPMPARDGEEYEEASAVYFSLYHRKAVVNGYSGNAPPGYRVVREAMEQFPSDATFDLMDDLGVGHVLVHTEGYRSAEGQAIVRRLMALFSRAEPVAEAGGDHLYRLIPRIRDKADEGPLKETGDRRKWKARASLNQKLVELAFDGDPKTGWSTGYPQGKDDFFELDLGEAVPLRKIVLVLNTNPLDYPRSFRVEGSVDGAAWTGLYEKAGFFPAVDAGMIEDFGKYVVPIPFGPAAVRWVRVSLTAPHEARHWSINEIACFK